MGILTLGGEEGDMQVVAVYSHSNSSNRRVLVDKIAG